ncbi:hypothetical protein ACWT_5862 [Actinoplanes sp. SE50]|uniref:hypothetical protein n=1 Tax=unclassified Actinoplanes TaxID=2626549 RepID=UPI00023EBDD2|nr:MULTISPECIES: hypothetical protein [unclassified Actinoplanes]AEV86880.1 hypothetical protein ACPL_5993 [Actinoplanes sp. SE50/110]ATO85277.1 hypothetical protein ACWT_5862 [Actinoplanes sp. SE50]SLM02687.1 hypothetical protein ACSP50_5969 [Actinoplanes sp. SE50/110]
MSIDYTGEVVGRDPVGKTIVEALVSSHPDWSDQQVTDRINREYDEPVITVAEVARWRPGMAR